MRSVVLVLLFFGHLVSHAQPAKDIVVVHFLYGSKPSREARDIEKKWFGGKLGGHVGIEISPDSILNFVPRGKFHVFPRRNDFHSLFMIHNRKGFYEIFGGNAKEMKTLRIEVPISPVQRIKLDSISKAYLAQTPFDYAFFGMRCGSSTYYILSELGVLKPYSPGKTSRKIFYPRKLRKRLITKAKMNHWEIDRQEGTLRRNWESD